MAGIAMFSSFRRRSRFGCNIEPLLMLRIAVPGAIVLLLCTQARAQTQAESRQLLLQHVEAGRIQEAIALGERASAEWPNDGDIRHWLGLAYFKSGALQPARQQLERARDLNPKDATVSYDLAL